MNKILQYINDHREIGESFYVLDLDAFEDNYVRFFQSFSRCWVNTEIAYSFKTNYIPDICKKVREIGGNAEVVSDMELYLAERLGFSFEKIYFNGPYKQQSVLERYLLCGGNVNVDSKREYENILDIAQKHKDRKFEIGLRCALDIGQDTPTRFGFSSNDIYLLVEENKKVDNVDIIGIHTHLPFRTLDSFEKRLDSIKRVLRDYPKLDELKYISVGGGYYGPVDGDFSKILGGGVGVPTYDDYSDVIGRGLSELFCNFGIAPKLVLEPGSALVANSMSLYAKVESIKTIKEKSYVTCVASTFDMNPTVRGVNRPITIHHAENDAICLTNADLVGYTCIEGDVLYRGFDGRIAENDYVEFHNVGSYSITMNPPFIRAVPPVVIIKGGTVSISRPTADYSSIFDEYTCMK